ncbi:MAG: hypothetical protein AVDCRST_MAG05-1770 [uncultured Rubrobacteraceae bacterium]|uniref:Uncharacterized protein n=1 Tax=uncultured Rubrobacteraceae bacterium TaxID=349277 RepID=A0A6J4SCQ2_9ACTN|nr:MAG: hypothetical protein AVDCRST_MAG05-1770 [uncultured Rubrobacteraceae bacterium]
MLNAADLQANHQHRNEMAQRVENDRLGPRLRAARSKKNRLASLARALGRRRSGVPQAAR